MLGVKKVSPLDAKNLFLGATITEGYRKSSSTDLAELHHDEATLMVAAVAVVAGVSVYCVLHL